MHSNPIILRPAIPSDAALLKHWDEQPHVIACDPNADWDWESELLKNYDWLEQLVAELDGRPIGFIQIIDPAQEESHYWGNVSENLRAIDIWIGEAEDLNKGYGTSMMHAAIERCFENPKITSILIDPLESNIRAHKFYERLGFKFLRKERFDEDDCLVYRLERFDWSR